LEDELSDLVKECDYCKATPCLLSKVYKEMMYVAEEMEDEAENKEIRHAMYCFVSKKLWGRLGRGFRKRIPHCIMSEIHDAYPAKKGTTYVGFKASNDEVVSDGGRDDNNSD
jgi:glutaredoxin